MSEREGPTWPAEGKAVAAEVSERIRSILAGAEAAAVALRHEAEQEAEARRRGAETEALKIIEEARREAERFLAERIGQVSKLSDDLLERGQSLVERLDQAEEVRSELAQLAIALGETAARLANEVRALPGPQVPDIAPAPGRRELVQPEPAATAEPEPEPRESAPEPAATIAPVPEPEPEPESEPVLEPTPLRPAPEPEPEPAAPAPAAEQEPAAEARSDVAPTEEEARLIEQVRAGEQERAADEPEPAATAGDNGSPAQAAPDTSAKPDQALGARLVALQMAVAGGNRGEVEAHLRRAFDLDDPAPMLDDIFGAGTPSEQRVVWS
jgi:outer membrane biosynthesis protein TonB